MKVDEKKLLTLLEETGVLQKGHFLLSSGMHSDKYLQCALILQYPDYAEELGRELAGKFTDMQIDLVASPALGGVVLGQETARALGCRAIFGERIEGVMQFRRGFDVKKGEKVLIVEDVVTTGGSVSEVIKLVEKKGGIPVGVGSIVDRSFEEPDFPCPYRSLIKLEIALYSPQDCPLCQEGLAFDKPGSRIGKS